MVLEQLDDHVGKKKGDLIHACTTYKIQKKMDHRPKCQM